MLLDHGNIGPENRGGGGQILLEMPPREQLICDPGG